jgi:hypothetical protein
MLFSDRPRPISTASLSHSSSSVTGTLRARAIRFNIGSDGLWRAPVSSMAMYSRVTRTFLASVTCVMPFAFRCRRITLPSLGDNVNAPRLHRVKPSVHQPLHGEGSPMG